MTLPLRGRHYELNTDRRPQCGTRNGYEFHRTHQEPPDDACRLAATNYMRERRGLALVIDSSDAVDTIGEVLHRWRAS